jgi:hypothetical protein
MEYPFDLVLKFGFDFGFVSLGSDWFRFDFVSHFTDTRNTNPSLMHVVSFV